MSRLPSLQEALEKRGWQVETTEFESKDRWSFRVWKLTSLWTPVGLQVRLSFEICKVGQLIENDVFNINVTPVSLEGAAGNFYLRPWATCVADTLSFLEDQRQIVLANTER